MGAITDKRNEIRDALVDTGYIVYGYPAENMSLPSIVLVPGNPYIEIESLGSSPRLRGQFNATLLVAANDNQAALINLETMIESVLANLPNGLTIGTFGNPKISQVGPSDVLTTDVVIGAKI